MFGRERNHRRSGGSGKRDSASGDRHSVQAHQSDIPAPSTHAPLPKSAHPGPKFDDPAKFSDDPARNLEHPAPSLDDPAKFLDDPARSLEHPAPSLGDPAKFLDDPARKGVGVPPTEKNAHFPENDALPTANPVIPGAGTFMEKRSNIAAHSSTPPRNAVVEYIKHLYLRQRAQSATSAFATFTSTIAEGTDLPVSFRPTITRDTPEAIST